MTGEGSKYIPLLEDREAVEVTDPRAQTDWGADTILRRKVEAKMYAFSTLVSAKDMLETQTDMLENAAGNSVKAFARAIDKSAYTSIISPAQESTDSSAGDTSVSSANKRKIIAFADVKGKSANDALDGTLDKDTIEKINNIFSERDVQEEICASLTPSAEIALRTDDDFQDLENTFSQKTETERRMGLKYRTIRWVPASNKVLPLLGTANIASTSGTTLGGAVELTVRDLEATNKEAFTVDASASAATDLTVAAVKTATGASEAAEVEVASKDLVYFWSPETLFIAERDVTIAEQGMIPENNASKYLYVAKFFGHVSLDDDRTLAFALKGTVHAALA